MTPRVAITFVGNAGADCTATGWQLLPDRDRMVTYLLLGLGLDVLFLLVYGGLNHLTVSRNDWLDLYFDWELAIPLVPWMIYPYLSIFVLLLLPPFALDSAELRRLALRLALAILVAGMVFLLLPARLGFRTAQPNGVLFELLYLLDQPHNLAPSLHVTFSALIVGALQQASSPPVRTALGIWLAIICVATVTVHQHHVVDVVAALLLARLLGAVGAVRYAPLVDPTVHQPSGDPS